MEWNGYGRAIDEEEADVHKPQANGIAALLALCLHEWQVQAQFVKQAHNHLRWSTLAHLLNEWPVQEVRASDAEVKDVHFRDDGVVEGIQEPGRVGDLQGNEMK